MIQPMRISFDSNAWEVIFAEGQNQFSSVVRGIKEGQLEGFICAAGFRIEAIRKRDRKQYFAQPYMGSLPIVRTTSEGRSLGFSFGPDNRFHPGLPEIQAEKLKRAINCGVKLIRGANWLGLPVPNEIADPSLYLAETLSERYDREQKYYDVEYEIQKRGVGHAAFLSAGGWDALALREAKQQRFERACSEWSDGELVAAHIAYGNDYLCTEDYAGSGVKSIFNRENRKWLEQRYGLNFITKRELVSLLRQFEI